MQLNIGRASIPQLIDATGALTDDVVAQLGHLRPDQLNWKPNPEEWSLGQCIDHLIVANGLYFAPIEQILAGKKVKTFWERLPGVPKLFARLLISSLDPERGQKVQTVKVFEPTESTIDPQVIETFVEQQHQLVDLMRKCERMDSESIIITSPAAPFITYSLLDAFRIIVIHEQHHFAQTSKIICLEGFPPSEDTT